MIQKVIERPYMPQIVPRTLVGVQEAFSSLVRTLFDIFSQYGFAINSLIDDVDFQGEYAVASMSGRQTSNLGSGNHIEFDTLVTNGSLVTLSTGAGQADGKLTLAAGHTYKLTGYFRVEWDIPAVGDRIFADLRNNTDAVVMQRCGLHSRDWDQATNNSDMPVTIAFLVTTTATKEIELRLASKVGTFTSVREFSSIFVEVLK